MAQFNRICSSTDLRKGKYGDRGGRRRPRNEGDLIMAGRMGHCGAAAQFVMSRSARVGTDPNRADTPPMKLGSPPPQWPFAGHDEVAFVSRVLSSSPRSHLTFAQVVDDRSIELSIWS